MMASQFVGKRSEPSLAGERSVESLLAALETLSSLHDPGAVTDLARRAAQDLTGSDGVTLLLRDEASEPERPLSLEGWAGRLSMSDRTPIVVVDCDSDPRVPRDAAGLSSTRGMVVVPMGSVDPVGALASSWDEPHEPHEDDVRLLQALAHCTASVLQNLSFASKLELRVQERTAELQRAHDAIHKLALTDELTNLCNRRGFYVLAEQALKHARRRGKPCVLLFLDLDGLKMVNDAHGHDAGDSLLAAAGEVLRRTFRHSDVIGRTGGDEFCVLALDSDDGGMVRDRLVDQIGRWNLERGSGFELSASLGIVEVPGNTKDKLDELLVRADRAMYCDKRQRSMSRSSAPPALVASHGPPGAHDEDQTSPPSGPSNTTNTTVY